MRKLEESDFVKILNFVDIIAREKYLSLAVNSFIEQNKGLDKSLLAAALTGYCSTLYLHTIPDFLLNEVLESVIVGNFVCNLVGADNIQDVIKNNIPDEVITDPLAIKEILRKRKEIKDATTSISTSDN